MPMVCFLCPDGHEFEKIVPGNKELHKWCKHCDKLTIWMEILEPHAEHYKEKVCSSCMGNQHIPPILSNETHIVEERITSCPECGKDAIQVVRIERRGPKDGIQNHSVVFRFNYMSSDD